MLYASAGSKKAHMTKNAGFYIVSLVGKVLIEFKYDKSAEIALEQIYSTGYSEQFISQRDKVIHLLGINFSKEEKNIKDWKEALL